LSAEASIAPAPLVPPVQDPVSSNLGPAQPDEAPEKDLHSDSDDEVDSDTTTDSEYVSFEDSDDDLPEYPETRAEREARASERQMVLEAAGLIVKTDKKPPPRPERRRSKSEKKRRPAPAAPQRASVISTSSSSSQPDKDLPPVPEAGSTPDTPTTPRPPSVHVQDAFDRYESFKKQHQSRLSVSSASDMLPPASHSPTSPTSSPNPARESVESRYSHFMSNILGRAKTPVEGAERPRLVISGPISGPVQVDSPQRAQSPAFGSVSFHNI
jgi:actin cytoskeleton-regulatory complex protein PAN1